MASVGRRREASLAGPHVAEALEALRRLAGDDPRPVGLREVNGRAALREARSCYDHLAGRAGVALADDLVARGALTEQFTVPDSAAGYYREAFGVDIGALPGRRPLVRPCTDWTERRPHVAGALGAALLDSMLSRGWLARRPDGRALNVTAAGRAASRRGGAGERRLVREVAGPAPAASGPHGRAVASGALPLARLASVHLFRLSASKCTFARSVGVLRLAGLARVELFGLRLNKSSFARSLARCRSPAREGRVCPGFPDEVDSRVPLARCRSRVRRWRVGAIRDGRGSPHLPHLPPLDGTLYDATRTVS